MCNLYNHVLTCRDISNYDIHMRNSKSQVNKCVEFFMAVKNDTSRRAYMISDLEIFTYVFNGIIIFGVLPFILIGTQKNLNFVRRNGNVLY